MNTSNGYENAPATRMLATHCAVCARPLVDAKSVEIGMGPDCRKKYGYNTYMEGQVSEDQRREANKLVYQIAIGHGAMTVVAAAEKLRELGFSKLADRVVKRCVDVVVTDAGGDLAVKAPFDERAIGAWRMIPGRRWDGDRKVNIVPAGQRRALWDLLRRFWTGKVLIGPKGAAVIG